MKCPKCGHWNKPSFPRCFKCGEPLNARAEMDPKWRREFAEPKPQVKREVYDDTVPPVEDFVEPTPTPVKKKDSETLATEMTRLKDRRARGSAYLQELRQNAAEKGIAPSGSGVSIRRTGGFFADVPDDPSKTLGAADTEPADMSMADEDIDSPGTAAERFADTAPRITTDATLESYDVDLPPAFDMPGSIAPHARRRRRRVRGPMLIVYILVGLLVTGVAGLGVYAVAAFIVPSITSPQGTATESVDIKTTIIDVDGHPGRRIEIPGEEGATVYIPELMKSYVVSGKVATIEVADHVFYDAIEPLDKNEETMDITLNPMKTNNNEETRLEPIRYTIDIPLTDIKLIEPEAQKVTVNASIISMKLQVPPNSRVLVNSKDESDTMDDEGLVTYSQSIQAIGNNVIAITVKAPYCRENTLNVTVYRAPMSIPIELDPATLTQSRTGSFTVHGTTQAGATISVDTPNTGVEMDAKSGKFSVTAKLSKVGNNTIIIRASYPGKEDSTLEHVVDFLPYAAEYTPKAWALSSSDYSELMNNIAMRVENAQIYLCQGVIKEILSENPQMVIMDTGKNGKEQLVMLENRTMEAKSNPWKLNEKYRVYADVSGVYNNIPRLVGRYTYEPLE